MSNNKQTAVEWLEECLSIHFTHEQKMQFEGLFQQAKAKHKQEMKEMYLKGIGNYDPTFKRKDKETFGGNNEQ